MASPQAAQRVKKRKPRDLHDLLWAWGKWRNTLAKGLGYSDASNIHRAIVYGAYLPCGTTNIVPLYFPDHEVTQLDQQIIKLPKQDKEILMYRYIGGCSFADIGYYINKYKSYAQYQLRRIERKLHLP